MEKGSKILWPALSSILDTLRLFLLLMESIAYGESLYTINELTSKFPGIPDNKHIRAVEKRVEA